MIVRVTQAEPYDRLWTEDEFHRLGDLGFFDGQQAELVDGDILVRGPSEEPHSRLWSKVEYYRMADLGFFEGQKAELLGGHIMVTSPQNWPHSSGWDQVAEVLRIALGPGVWVRTQAPLDLGLVSEPEPDVSVVPGSRDSYSAHPRTALLIVEVSDSTLASDRSLKASLYACGGVADYWIVNLVDEQLEVHRNPVPDPSRRHGYRYADVMVLTRADVVTPRAFPGVSLPVVDLLP